MFSEGGEKCFAEEQKMRQQSVIDAAFEMRRAIQDIADAYREGRETSVDVADAICALDHRLREKGVTMEGIVT